jgi:hypothetical protein
MKTVLFTYESPVGTFWIRPEPAGRVQLGIEGHRLRTYNSPKAAARDVAMKNTGWAPWDTLENVVVPRELNKWKRPPSARTRRSDEMRNDSYPEDE